MEILSSKLTSTSINTWFSDCEPVALEENRLVLYTKQPYKRDIIIQRFSETIRETMRELFSCDFDLTVLAGDEELSEYQDQETEKDILPEMNGYTFDNFIVGSSNKFAHAAALGVVKRPGRQANNPLFIYGRSGLGKTHLLMAIGTAIHEKMPDAKIVYVKGDEFLNDIIHSLKEGEMEEFRMRYRYADLFLVDDIHFIAGKERSQEEFFHTFNNIYESGHQIVLTSDRPPMEMALLDDRLLMADIQPPDLETRMAIIRDKAGHLGMVLSDQVVYHIAEKLTSDIRQIEGVVKKLTAYSEMTEEQITKELVDKTIADVIRTGNYIPTPDDIIRETANFYNVTVEDIKGQKRSKNIAMARHVSIYLIRTLINLTLNDIGMIFEDRNHGTIHSSIQKIEKKISEDRELAGTIRDITSNINSRQRQDPGVSHRP